MTSIELTPLVPDAMERIETMVGLYESGSVSFGQLCNVAVEGFGTKSEAATALTLAMMSVRSWQTGDADLRDARERPGRAITPGFEAELYQAICRRLGTNG
ncbi:hypothetical protein GCM10017083_04910 [Thalassobaculum fulvum]|uniref:Uncharacterized protein n=1 Tax=Thalassobaculum fulvum TaxID=1633335 RepID=A0A918XN51_9PROT|nr:hypothetical protein [Thalassobaculum fulvum]GHD41037.1 hypothetical protein GCM10017083_04910 [Thalassobaculum fulvum]